MAQQTPPPVGLVGSPAPSSDQAVSETIADHVGTNPVGADEAVVDRVANSETIATLDPIIPDSEIGYPISARTGEPRRPGVIMAACVAGWVSVATTVVAFGLWWWQAAHIATFTESARLLTWTNPDPVSALAIAMVLVIGLISVLMVAAAGMVAYNCWVGQRWIRIAGLVCLVVTGLSFLLNWWFSVAMIPLAIALILVWLPWSGRFFAAMSKHRAPTQISFPTTDIRYGPQPLIGQR